MIASQFYSRQCKQVPQAHTEQLTIVDFLIRLCNARLLSTILYPCQLSLTRYALIIGPGRHWFHEL